MSFLAKLLKPANKKNPPRLPKPRVISFLNQKGGVGKTTTTVNVGAALAEMGWRVLMVDLDPQAHMSLSLGHDPATLEHTLHHLFTDPTISAAQIVRMADGKSNLGVLPAETNLAGLEQELMEQIAAGTAQTLLRDRTADLRAQFDFVLVDCPPALGLLTVNALAMSDEVVIPMQPHYLALQGMGKLLETVALVHGALNPNLRVAGVVLCMHERQTLLAAEVEKSVRDFFEAAAGSAEPWAGAVVFEPPIRRNVKLAEAPGFGKSVIAYAPDSNGAADYVNLARALVKHSPLAAASSAAPAA